MALVAESGYSRQLTRITLWNGLRTFRQTHHLAFTLDFRFGKELTADGRKEQALWREQRLRNLQGLALRSQQRFGGKE